MSVFFIVLFCTELSIWIKVIALFIRAIQRPTADLNPGFARMAAHAERGWNLNEFSFLFSIKM